MQDGCAKRTHCELDYLFDIVHAWCTYPGDVECGTRPSPSTTSTTKRTTTSDCGHFLDCRGMADGFYGDPYNCRRVEIVATYISEIYSAFLKLHEKAGQIKPLGNYTVKKAYRFSRPSWDVT
jgi:hypothetical protein